MSALLGTAWHAAQRRRHRAVAAAIGGSGMACRPAGAAMGGADVAAAVGAGRTADPSAGLLKAITGEGAPPT